MGAAFPEHPGGIGFIPVGLAFPKDRNSESFSGSLRSVAQHQHRGLGCFQSGNLPIQNHPPRALGRCLKGALNALPELSHGECSRRIPGSGWAKPWLGLWSWSFHTPKFREYWGGLMILLHHSHSQLEPMKERNWGSGREVGKGYWGQLCLGFRNSSHLGIPSPAEGFGTTQGWH